jgi:hypothetical protein
MRFLRRTSGYTSLDTKKSEDILQELKVDPIMDFVQEYRKSWKEHVIRTNNNRLLKKKFKYFPCGQRSVGRPARRWAETVTDR